MILEFDKHLSPVLSKVFTGISIRTEENAVYGIALRDDGLEITCPDGTLVGIKGGKASCRIERNCKEIS